MITVQDDTPIATDAAVTIQVDEDDLNGLLVDDNSIGFRDGDTVGDESDKTSLQLRQLRVAGHFGADEPGSITSTRPPAASATSTTCR